MTHQITSINEYLLETMEIAKRNQVRKLILSGTIFLAFISLGFGIYSSSEVVQNTDNQYNIHTVSSSEENQLKLGKVYLAFDPDELNGVEDLDTFLSKQRKDSEVFKITDPNFLVDKWTEHDVRNQIVIKGNYYAGQ